LAGEDVNVAVYGMHGMLGTGEGVSADHAVEAVTRGVERTMGMMK
jgi:hypothetical protein